ncbi:MAG: hypothetical protein JXO22_00820 [Phycisphaerae bacterium]|nr:hypothetical protein [Phycisphaerae bacterium]
MMRSLIEQLGVEQDLDNVNRALCREVLALNAPTVGALHITCADESEWECIDSFQKCFVQRLLPELKFGVKTPFRLANLGARYERGAIAVAEHHYATPESRDAFKVLVVKINAHVAVDDSRAVPYYGRMNRYETESTACGALHALMGGSKLPFADDLREAFGSEGHDRLAALADLGRISADERGLFVAMVSARLQTRRVELDIHHHAPASPTLYIVTAVVTLNRTGRDTELPCGLYIADHRGDTPKLSYAGLGDDPLRYLVQYDQGKLVVREPSSLAEPES